MADKKMDELADLLADEDTVLRGAIAVSGVKIMGHKYLGPDRTVSMSFRTTAISLKTRIFCGVMWKRSAARPP